MRILILTQTFPLNPTDSTAPFMFDFAYGFSQLGHQVTVFVPMHPKLRPNAFKGIKIKPFRYIWPNSLHLLGFGRTLENDQKLKWFVLPLAPLFIISAIFNLYQVVRSQRIEVISAHWVLPSGFVGAVVSRLTGIPLVVTLPGSDVYLARQNFLFKLAGKFTRFQAKKIVSNSGLLLKDFKTKGPIISYPVPENLGHRRSNPIPTIVSAGRLVEKKGFKYLLEAYPDIEILHGLSIDEFRQKLLSADIFIAPSIRDSKGNPDDASLTVLEAMAAGCAVITTNLPGNRQLIRNNVNGLLIPPGNKQALVKTTKNLTSSAALRRRFGQAARKSISQKFTPQKIAQRYLDVFLEATTK